MSNLYIRVRTGFYTHRKTARLQARIGDDAFWIPPRLWAYCAENQPDGDISGYGSEELALLLGCPKHATSILQALLDVGFVDQDLKIHDWEEHNGYHQSYAERASKAARARWSKTSPAPPTAVNGNRKEESGDKHCLEHATSINGKKTDAEFIAELKVSPAYTGINIDTEFEKMRVWCMTNQKKPSQRRFVNWLNRVERPMNSGPTRCAPRLSEVRAYIDEKSDDSRNGHWAASFISRMATLKWMKNGVPVDWKVELSRQLNEWRTQ